MGVDRETYQIIGWVLSEKDIPKALRRTKPEEFHWEDRFDEKTGKKLKPERVIDEEEHEIFLLPGKKSVTEYHRDELDQFFDAIATEAKMDYVVAGDGVDGNLVYCLTLKTTKKQDDDGLPIEVVIKKQGELEAAKKKLQALGFKVGSAKIQFVEYYY